MDPGTLPGKDRKAGGPPFSPALSLKRRKALPLKGFRLEQQGLPY